MKRFALIFCTGCQNLDAGSGNVWMADPEMVEWNLLTCILGLFDMFPGNNWDPLPSDTVVEMWATSGGGNRVEIDELHILLIRGSYHIN